MTAYLPHPVRSTSRFGARRRHLLLGCALGTALALSVHGERASAQAFNGNYTPRAGDVSRTVGSGTETITVNSPTAIIEWNNAADDFLPDNNLATFTGATDFAVLNRIFSANGGPIQLNGDVVSRVQGQAGGTVLFQSSGGIIVGATATFDVGSLVLTTLGIAGEEDGYGNLVDFTPGDYQFSGESQSLITIDEGAQINAPSEGSSVIVVASSIYQNGDVRVNGSVAYVAARNAEVRVNDGLFDIVIGLGASGGELYHSGSTGGPASTGAGDTHAIYMVTRGASEAASLFLGGDVGFDQAVSAGVENGVIVLSAGYDVANGAIDEGSRGPTDDRITLSNGTFSSDVIARAQGNVEVYGTFGVSTTFNGDLTAIADNDVYLLAGEGGQIRIEGDFRGVSTGLLQDGPNLFTGNVDVRASDGGAITILGDATLDASARAYFNDSSTAGSGIAGTVRVNAFDGSVSIGGDLNMLATGEGAFDPDFIATGGGTGDGGNAFISGSSGTISVGGNLNVDVSGIGSRTDGDADVSAPVGGGGFGGFISINGFNGGLTVAGDSTLTARGIGGELVGGSQIESGGGFGSGGFVSIGADGASGFVDLGGATEIDVSGVGGDGGTNGGDGDGGFVSVGAFGAGVVDLGTGLEIAADGTGGEGISRVGGRGFGGSIEIDPSDGTPGPTGAPATVRAGNASLSADGIGGAGGDEGGLGSGGFVTLVAVEDGGAIQFGNVLATALGIGGDGDVVGGLGEGGSILAGTETGYGSGPSSFNGEGPVEASTGPAQATFGNLDFDASGIGGNGATGGAGLGGDVTLAAPIGDVTFGGDSRFTALGTGGDGTFGAGGAGTGGTAVIRADSGATIDGTAGTTVVDVSGIGGDGFSGGAGNGGTIRAGGFGGAVTLAGNITARSNGTGGSGNFGNGGNGAGGLIDFYARDGGSLAFATASLIADGVGGEGSLGGTGQGGFTEDPVEEGLVRGVFLSAISGGTISGGTAGLSAQGTGGDSTRGVGGEGLGGTAQIFVANSSGAPGSIDLGSANVNLSAFGGVGGAEFGYGGNGYDGGAATAGRLLVAAETLNGSIAIDDLGFVADATGGAGGAATGASGIGGRGGDAFGGDTQFGTVSGNAPGAAGGSGVYGDVTGSASATGGAGGASGGPNGAAGDGGTGTGGRIALLTRGGTMQIGAVSLNASGRGGNAGAGLGGEGGIGVGGAVTALFTTRFLTSSAPTATIASLRLVAEGTGGNGSVNGTGGEGAGGTIFAGTEETGYGAVGGSVDLGDLVMSANGQGGGGGAGGNGGGGIVDLQAQLIPVVFDTAIITADGTGGGSLAPAPNPGLGAGGQIVIASRDATGTLGGGSLSGSASGFGSSPTNNSVGTWQVSVDNGAIIIDSVTLDASVDGAFVEGPASTIDLNNGAFNVGTSGFFFATGQIQVNAAGSGTMTGGDQLLRASELVLSHEGRAASGATIATASFTAQLSGDFIANEGVLTRTSGQTNIEANGTAFIAGEILGAGIYVRTSDIDISDSGFLGDPSTDRVELEVVPTFGQTGAQQVVIGGDEEGEGYTLTADEAGRIRTRELDIFVPASSGSQSGAPAAVIRDLTLRPGTGSTGAGVNTFQVTLGAGEGGGDGILQVEGNLRFENAGAEDGIVLIAPGRVQVVNPTGSIRVLGANGLPGGTLGIQSDNIWSASQELLDQLAENPNFEGRNEALLNNDGEVEERGYIEAGEILLRVGETLFVQNSGTLEAMAGITVVQNTLTIEPTGQSPIDVYAFGRRINADGSFVLNSPYFREVAFEDGYGGYLDGAEFNQCVIATGACPDDAPTAPPEIPIGPEIIEGPIEETEDSVPTPTADRQEFVDVSFSSESLLEEPVTSGGDSGVWDGDDECAPDDATCENTNGGGN